MNNCQGSPVSTASPTAIGRLKVGDGHLLFLVTLLALAVRLPYWRTIPAAGDEVKQAIHALQIAQGQGFPLVGNDAYAGPFFFYLLALLIRLGVADPLTGRTIVLIAGTLTATVTYAWVRRLHGGHIASLVAATLVAVNPHLILLNSHVGGTTFLLPFLTTAFLWLLSKGVELDRWGWLIASGFLAGLAIQSNPVAGLPVVGGWVWATLRMRRSPRLGRRWPLWPLVTGLCIVFVYSPVIIYNASSHLDSVNALDQRSYLWEANPTIHTFLSNELRLAQQLVRQVSGVLTGDETLRTMLGMPLIYLAWMLAGLAFITRRTSLLPLAAIVPFLIVLPYLSSHYGLINPVRFTSLLTPVFAVGMGVVFAAAIEHAADAMHPKGIHTSPVSAAPKRAIVAFAPVVLILALVAYPLVSLRQYYSLVEKNHQTGRALLGLSQHMVEANRGEPAYISHSLRTIGVSGIPYVPRTYLLFANIHQEFLSPEQIIGRLFESPGPAFLLIGDQDAIAIQQFASLTPWPGKANEEAHQRGYGLYTLDTEVPLVKPGFVLSGDSARDVAPQVPVGVPLGGGIELIGYDAPTHLTAGETLDLTLYWQAAGPRPREMYMGFVHLSKPDATLIAQDDHVLGHDQYPANAWQPGEIVVDHYALRVPDDAVPGKYTLQAGIYTWPDLVRLDVPGHPDDIVELEPVDIGR